MNMIRDSEEPMRNQSDGALDDLRTLALTLGTSVENAVDTIRRHAAERLRPDRRLQIAAYGGFGGAERVHVSGRVLAWRESPSLAPDSLWSRLQENYRRFDTDEVADEPVSLTITLPGAETSGAPRRIDLVTRSDEEGYFTVDIDLSTVDRPVPQGNLPVLLSLPARSDPAETPATVVRPGADARFGIISDIDDTVLVTGATSLVKMMRLTFLETSASRLAFDGVAEFYKALVAGGNPLFYVSSSPWNLHDFLEDFMSVNGIPGGPMLLRDYGLDRDKLIAGPHREHKLGSIRKLLQALPDLPFVLVGDSGQHDPEIYHEIVREHPGRIQAIYIRDVAGDVRDRNVQVLAQDLEARGVPLLLVPDTLGAALHAAHAGFIDDESVEAVRAAVRRAEEYPVTGKDPRVMT